MSDLIYKKLGYVALNVSDLERSRRYYEQMLGLEFCGEGPQGEVFLRCSADHHNLMLCAGDEPGLKRIGWQLRNALQLDVLRERLARAGVPVDEVPASECRALGLGRTLRMTEPHSGAIFDFYAEVGQCAAPPEPTVAKIQRLGHVVFRTPRYADSVAFATAVLGFQLSDEIDGQISFLRCAGNPLHHSLGIGNGARPGLHHINFMVSEIDDIGRALTRFRRNGVPVVYGPGRHPPSHSVFLYFLDPDGLTLEYSFGMEEFAATGAREPRVLPPVPASYDFWGNERDPRMSAVGAIASSDATILPGVAAGRPRA